MDWERNTITVRSCKTEHHQGGEQRVIPLFSDLRPHLLAVFEAAEPGTEWVISSWRDPGVNLRKKLLGLIRRAGLQAWPKLWHNLRASAETDLAREYPLQTVAEWLGHNPAVMVTHYLSNPDLSADFQRAAGTVGGMPRVGGAEAARTSRETVGNGGKQAGRKNAETPENTALQGFLAIFTWAIEESNL